MRSSDFLDCHLSYQVVFRGATCSGKTTLCVHLNKILPDSFIIHQDVRCSAVDYNLTVSYLFRTLILCVCRKWNHLWNPSDSVAFPSLKTRCLSILFTITRMRTQQKLLFHGMNLLNSSVRSRRQVLSHPITKQVRTSLHTMW